MKRSALLLLVTLACWPSMPAQARELAFREASRDPVARLFTSNDLSRTGGVLLRKPSEIDAWGFQAATLEQDVWSGWGWPKYMGHTAWRYTLYPLESIGSWDEAYRKVSSPGSTYFEIASSKSSISIDDLSPAEKYDLLISDPSEHPRGLLSRHEWEAGRKSHQGRPSAPRWTGYCHGWAPASYHVRRPLKEVEVVSANGRDKIRFTPTDIKALVSALWANSKIPYRLIGTRCPESAPKTDRHGRVLNRDCFNVNPGAFHLAIVNQLANARRPLIIDSFYDREIWNYPVVSYSYVYFNPITRQETSKFSQAVVSPRDYTADRYKKWRSRSAHAIVGVKMWVKYRLINEPRPTSQTFHSHTSLIPAQEDTNYLNVYLYDLELDASGAVIGGEWNQEHHPDFIWTTAPHARAVSGFEADAHGHWSPMHPLPSSWRQAAQKGAVNGTPLAKIVDRLLDVSRHESE